MRCGCCGSSTACCAITQRPLGAPINTAAADWIAAQPHVRFADSPKCDPLPALLSLSEAKHLIAFLSEVRLRPLGVRGGRGVRSGRDGQRAFTWQALRNRTALALQLGAGLTPADVRVLTLQSPTVHGGQVKHRPWKLAVPGNGNSAARETPVAPWAGELLRHWLQVRSELQIAGPYLLPATRSGKPWSRPGHYMAAKQVLADAGLDSSEGGSFRLRHTFALRQLLLLRFFTPSLSIQSKHLSSVLR